MNNVVYTTTCRHCQKTISAPIPANEAVNDSEGKRVRCGKCGKTNFIRNHETEGRQL